MGYGFVKLAKSASLIPPNPGRDGFFKHPARIIILFAEQRA
jgi:hypothetical protein